MTATFFLDAPLSSSTGAVAKVPDRGPETPVLAAGPDREAGRDRQREDSAAGDKKAERSKKVSVPRDKKLTINVPKMKRVRNSVIPYASGQNEEAFKDYTAVHLRGTGFPWQKEANVYIAGHRLGYVGTPSFLAFWDLNEVEVGDKIFVTDAKGRRYVYEVFDNFIVEPTDVYVMEPVEGKNILTLQTCTLPDYSQRLIVQAERVA